MKLEDVKIGAWVIWDGDTYPHPRQILRRKKDGYVLNIKHSSSRAYIECDKTILIENLKYARLCRENEIPTEFRTKEPLYTIY